MIAETMPFFPLKRCRRSGAAPGTAELYPGLRDCYIMIASRKSLSTVGCAVRTDGDMMLARWCARRTLLPMQLISSGRRPA